MYGSAYREHLPLMLGLKVEPQKAVASVLQLRGQPMASWLMLHRDLTTISTGIFGSLVVAIVHHACGVRAVGSLRGFYGSTDILATNW